MEPPKSNLKKLHEQLILEELTIIKDVSDTYNLDFWSLVNLSVTLSELNLPRDWSIIGKALIEFEEKVRKSPLYQAYQKAKEEKKE